MEGTEVRKILAKNIRRLREERNMSQADLAFSAGISVPFLGAIERENKWPHPDTIAKIATVFGVEIFELFLLEGLSKAQNIQCGKILAELCAVQNSAARQVLEKYFE